MNSYPQPRTDPDAGELTASFDGRAVTYGFGELDTLVPAYAVTIHKSQGSEYPAVVIPVLTQHYTGVARSALDIARAHAQTRVAFGQKLGQKQLIWDMIAEMRWRIDAAELLTYRAAKMYDAGHDGKALMSEAAQAKLVATEAANFCADRTVQILGGDGVTKEYGRAEQIYRDARALPIVGGTSEMVKYLIAARELPEIKLNL